MKRFLCIALVLFASSAWGEGWLKQSTAATLKLGPFVDSTDGVTAETGLTIAQGDIQISKAGAAFAQTSDAAPTTTHDVDGWYPIPLTTTDTGTLGRIVVQVQVAGAVPVWWEGMVVPAVVYDSMVAGSDYLQSETVAMATGVVTADAIATDAIGAAEVAASALTAGTEIVGFSDDADVADAVLDELLAGHTTAGSLGKYIADILEDTGTTLDDLLDTEIAAILADTGTDGVVLANDAITAAKIAADAIGSSEIATDAIGAAEVAASALTAGTEIVGFSDDADIADAVLDEALSGHTTAGSAGKALSDIESDATAILADTNELQTDDVPGLIAALDALIDAIKAKTDNLPADPADDSDIDAALATIDGNVDSVLEDTGTTIPAAIAALPTDADVATQAGVALTAYDPPTATELAAVQTHGDSTWVTATEVGLSDGAITATKIADDALTAAKFATDSITSDAIAANAAQEIGAEATGSGSGDTPVDHTSDATLGYTTSGSYGSGTGIGDAIIRAYLKSEYDTGTYTLRGASVTDDDGGWEYPIYLDSGLTYTITYRHPNYATAVAEYTVP